MVATNPFVEMAAGYPLLSITIFLPVLGAILVAFVPKQNAKAVQCIGILFSSLTLAWSVLLWNAFDSVAGFQMVDRAEWLPGGIQYLVGVDGLNILLVLLTAILTPLVLLSAVSVIQEQVKAFVIAVLLFETAVLGSVLALDLVLFFFFSEAVLIPMYFLIGIWGGKDRIYASTKFLAYTVFGSALMLIAVVYLYLKTGSTSSAFVDLLTLELTQDEQKWLFLACAFSFAIRVPLMPFHTWLPDANTQAPTPGAVLLSGVMLSIGAYAFLRIGFPLFPYAAGLFSTPIMALAVMGILYGAFLAHAQTDLKKLFAYASMSHLGFILLGVFALTESGVEGALLHMFNHGIITAGLLFCAGILYERRQTYTIAEFGGLAKQMPLLTVFFAVMMLSSIAVPGTNGFAGEFLIILGAFQEALHSQLLPVTPWNPSLGINENLNNMSGWLISWRVATTTLVVLAIFGAVCIAVFMLSMFRRVMLGPSENKANSTIADLNFREVVYLAPLAVLVFAIGFFPNTMMDKTHASIDAYIAHVRPAVADARAPISEKIKRSRKGLTSVDPGAPPGATREHASLPAAPAHAALPQGGR